MASRKETPIWGSFESSDARTLDEPTSRLTLYKMVDDVPTAVTLAADDIVEISDLHAYVTTTMIVSVYDGADNVVGAGELISKLSLSTLGANDVPMSFETPHKCSIGTYPKVITTLAGVVAVQLRGNLLSVRD